MQPRQSANMHWQDGSEAEGPVHFAGPVRAAGSDKDGGAPSKPCCQPDVTTVPTRALAAWAVKAEPAATVPILYLRHS